MKYNNDNSFLEGYNWVKVNPTNNLFLRFIGNRCSDTYSFAIMQLVRLEEDGKAYSFIHRYWSKIASLTWLPTKKWATYYKHVPNEDTQP